MQWSSDFWTKLLTKAKIRVLLKECLRTPTTGTGKPESLKHDFTGFWSRRISGEHRLIYRFEADLVYVLQCRFHYTKK